MTYAPNEDASFNSSVLDDILIRASGRDPLEEKLRTICDDGASAKDRAKAANGLTVLLRGAEGDYMARVGAAEGIVQAIIELLHDLDPWVRGAGAGLLANMTGPGCPLQTRVLVASTRNLLPTLAIELASGNDYGRHAVPSESPGSRRSKLEQGLILRASSNLEQCLRKARFSI